MLNQAAVKAGKLTAAQGTTEKAQTTERVTNMVERVKGLGHKGDKGGARAQIALNSVPT